MISLSRIVTARIGAAVKHLAAAGAGLVRTP
jgi:hypothetical protein